MYAIIYATHNLLRNQYAQYFFNTVVIKVNWMVKYPLWQCSLDQLGGFHFIPLLDVLFTPPSIPKMKIPYKPTKKNLICIQKMKNFNPAVRLYRLYNQG